MAPDAPSYFDKTFPEGFTARLSRAVFSGIYPRYLRFCLHFGPAYYSIIKKHVILSFDYVQEAFARYDDLEVPHDNKTGALKWNPAFLLARRDDDAEYRRIHGMVREYWSANLKDFRDIARQAFESRLTIRADGDHRIDAIHEYMIPAFWEIIEKHYGVEIQDGGEKNEFTHALLVISSFFFGSVKGSKKVLPHARKAFEATMKSLDKVIADAQKPNAQPVGVLAKMLADQNMAKAEMPSWLLGMILGFIPTSTNAQGRALEVFLTNDEAMKWIKDNVDSVPNDKGYGGSGKLLAGCHEALRLNYILPALFRVAKNDVVLGRGTTRPYKIEKGAELMLSGQTAMFDPQRNPKPTRFNPYRPFVSYLNYGHRMHYCVGWDLSDIVMEETFRALALADVKAPSRRRIEWRGAFPWVNYIKVTLPLRQL